MANCEGQIDRQANIKSFLQNLENNFQNLKEREIQQKYKYDNKNTLADFFDEEKVNNWKDKCENLTGNTFYPN